MSYSPAYIVPGLYWGVAWDVRVLDEVEAWLLSLDDDSYDRVAAAIDKLSDDGPALGRPLVDRISRSRHHNMKELRPGWAGASKVRILFVFDPAASRPPGSWRQGRGLERLVPARHRGRGRALRPVAQRRT